jgi:hypothetical protein
MAAADGQTFSGQSAQTQAAFNAAYGSGAASAWEAEHNAAIGYSTPSTPTAPTNYTTLDTGYGANVQAAQMAMQAAANAAQQAYLNAKLNLDSEDLALRKAQQAWTETVQRAGLTGIFEGQPTFPAMQYYANTFGAWNQPALNQPTLAAQAQWAQLYGQNAPPYQGQQTLGALQQQFGQALASIQEARAAQGQQQQQAQAYLNLLAQLRGPADWAKYQQVLGATPGGMRDLTAAAMGQYIPGGGATTGVQPTPVSLQSMQQQIAAGGGAAGQLSGLPAPNQLAPQSWRNLAPSQQQLLIGAYEAQGWNPDDVRALFSQSLPRYASNAPMAGTFRLAA